MKQLPYIIIIVLILIIFFQRSCVKPQQPVKPIRDTITKIDTFYQPHTDTVPKYVPVPKLVIKHDTSYKASDDVQELRAQFVELAGKYFAQNVYKDSLKIDTIGSLILTDTISHNRIEGRSYTANYKLPIITKETLIKEQVPQKSQVYIGGEIIGQKQTFIQGAYLGVLFKNKKDQIFGIKGGIDIQGQPLIGVSSYWKIKFHK